MNDATDAIREGRAISAARLRRIAELEAEVARLREKLTAMNRITSPGSRTLDELIRDMRYACDIARSGITPKEPPR